MATTYYVAAAGSDSNNGTSTGTPFLTVSHAASVVVTGDTVLGNGGDTFTENPTFSVALALFGAYGTGTPTLISAANTTTAINFTVPPTLVENWTIEGTTSAFPNAGAPLSLTSLRLSTTTTRSCAAAATELSRSNWSLGIN